MPLKKPRYRILLDDPDKGPTEHDVDIIYGDQLRAELEGPRHGLTRLSDAPLHFSALWVWAACTRTGLTDQPFQAFKSTLVALEPVDPEELDDVDPTKGRTGSP